MLFATSLLCSCAWSGNSTSHSGNASSGNAIVVVGGRVTMVPSPPPPSAENQSRFKAEPGKLEVIAHDKEKHEFTAKVVFWLRPTIEDNNKFARVFLGLASVWDGSMYPGNKEVLMGIPCDDAPGCYGRTAWDMRGNPIFVRGSKLIDGVQHPFNFRFPDSAKSLRLQWDFYQLEHDDGFVCEVIEGGPKPVDGIPFVHGVKQGTSEPKGWCYNDSANAWFLPVPENSPSGGDKGAELSSRP